MIVIDVNNPSDCQYCPMSDWGFHGTLVGCNAKGQRYFTERELSTDGKPDWCPIIGEEQEPKTGHWILSDDGLYRPICDKCGAHPWKGYIPTVEEATEVFKYCPNCGAKMVELQEEPDVMFYPQVPGITPTVVKPQESDHKCHTCKHYTSGENDGSCGSYICKGYSNWESEG